MIRPIDLPKVRAELVAFLGRQGTRIYQKFLDAGLIGFGDRSIPSPAGTAEKLALQEMWRLARAELFWVEDQMIDLVTAAAPSMPRFTLQPEDLPSPYGMIVFARPLRVMDSPDGLDDHVHITTAVWGDGTVAGAPNPGVWVSWYSDTTLNWETADPRRLAPGVDWRSAGFPPLSYDNEAYLPFSDAPLPWRGAWSGEESDEDPGHYPLAELRTAWTLMQQPVASVSEAHLDRAMRRRLQRDKIEPKSVRVITLRRPVSTAHGVSDREYHHRWIVRGHWRQQWYASRQVHRPVWIAPHIKGPDGAPMLGGERVYAWTR